MTNNTQFKTLLNTWLNQKKPMITPSTHASFTLIAENHLIPYFGKRKIGSITETDIQSYISFSLPIRAVGQVRWSHCEDHTRCDSRTAACYGVRLQREGDPSAELRGLDRVPERAGCQEGGFSVQGSGASSYSVHLHGPEQEDRWHSHCTVYRGADR